MGVQMQAFANMLGRNEDVKKAVLEEMPLGTTLDDLKNCRDPDVNMEVHDNLRRVEDRLIAAENSRLIDQFRILCLNAGIELEWRETHVDAPGYQMEEPVEEDPFVAARARIQDLEIRDAPRSLDVSASRMRHVKSGKVTAEILAEGQNDQILRVGNTVYLNCEGETVSVLVVAINSTYKGYSDLMNKGGRDLAKWQPLMDPGDSVVVAKREFGQKKYEGKTFVAFEFELA